MYFQVDLLCRSLNFPPVNPSAPAVIVFPANVAEPVLVLKTNTTTTTTVHFNISIN
ncbi:MAG: hypothetical protein IPK10_04155 [Bacteroidetes bacterium]|nr:hypothetical protein [Bacteroidota bacterium]